MQIGLHEGLAKHPRFTDDYQETLSELSKEYALEIPENPSFYDLGNSALTLYHYFDFQKALSLERNFRGGYELLKLRPITTQRAVKNTIALVNEVYDTSLNSDTATFGDMYLASLEIAKNNGRFESWRILANPQNDFEKGTSEIDKLIVQLEQKAFDESPAFWAFSTITRAARKEFFDAHMTRIKTRYPDIRYEPHTGFRGSLPYACKFIMDDNWNVSTEQHVGLLLGHPLPEEKDPFEEFILDQYRNNRMNLPWFVD